MSIMITGHAGCGGGRPNSLEGIKRALTCAADCLEVDCRLCYGEVILTHDPPEPAEHYTRLAEVLPLIAAAGKAVNCDLKEEAAFWPCLELARQHDLEARLFFSGSIPLADLPDQASFKAFINLELLLETAGLPEWRGSFAQMKQAALAGKIAEADELAAAWLATHWEGVAALYEPFAGYKTVAGLNINYRWLLAGALNQGCSQGGGQNESGDSGYSVEFGASGDFGGLNRSGSPSSTQVAPSVQVPPSPWRGKVPPLSLWTVDDEAFLKELFDAPGAIVNITSNRPDRVRILAESASCKGKRSFVYEVKEEG